MIPADWMEQVTAQMPKGAFLMVNGNPMTIGWCQYGVLWGKLCCTVYVRESRYTHDLLQAADTFTISVPSVGTMQSELAYCGSHSGRDGNKVQAIDAALIPARYGAQDGLSGCKYHIECRILCRSDLPIETLEDATLRNRYYGAGDPHTLYIGEIIGVTTEESK